MKKTKTLFLTGIILAVSFLTGSKLGAKESLESGFLASDPRLKSNHENVSFEVGVVNKSNKSSGKGKTGTVLQKIVGATTIAAVVLEGGEGVVPLEEQERRVNDEGLLNNNSSATSISSEEIRDENREQERVTISPKAAEHMTRALQAAMAGHQNEPHYWIKAAEQSQKALEYRAKISAFETAEKYELAHLWTAIAYKTELIAEKNTKIAELFASGSYLAIDHINKDSVHPFTLSFMNCFMTAIEHGNKITGISEREKMTLLTEASLQAHKIAQEYKQLNSDCVSNAPHFALVYEAVANNLKGAAHAFTQAAEARTVENQESLEQWNIVGTQSLDIVKRYFQEIQNALKTYGGFSSFYFCKDDLLSLATVNNVAAANGLKVESSCRAEAIKAQNEGNQQRADQWNSAAIHAQTLTKQYLGIVKGALTGDVKKGDHQVFPSVSHCCNLANNNLEKEIKYIKSAAVTAEVEFGKKSNEEASKQWDSAILQAQSIVENSLQIAQDVSLSSNWWKNGYYDNVTWNLAEYLSSAGSNNTVAADCLEREINYINQAAEARVTGNQQVIDRWNAIAIQAQVITERWIRAAKTVLTEKKTNPAPDLAMAAIVALGKQAEYTTQITQAAKAGSQQLADQKNALAVQIWMAVDQYVQAVQAAWAGNTVENQRLTPLAQKALAAFSTSNSYSSTVYSERSLGGKPGSSGGKPVEEPVSKKEEGKLEDPWAQVTSMIQEIMQIKVQIDKALHEGKYDEVRRLTQAARAKQQAAEAEMQAFKSPSFAGRI